MKLSIIVPVFNCEKYLIRCLNSLVNQTLNDYEVIIINDGSSDSSQKIIDEFSSKYSFIKSIVIDNGGQGRARNFGIDVAKGDFIGFADADDYVDDSMYEKLISLAEKENSDIAVCDFYRFEDTNKAYEKAALQNHPLSAAGAVWNKVFRKETIGNTRFPSGLWYEDLQFSSIVMLKAKKISYLNEALYFYRSDNPSTMRNKNAQKNLDIITVFENISEQLPEGQNDNFEFLLINHILLESIKRVDEIGDRAVVKTLRDYVKSYIPKLRLSKSFSNESLNRRIIMMLNYLGLDKISMFILKVK